MWMIAEDDAHSHGTKVWDAAKDDFARLIYIFIKIGMGFRISEDVTWWLSKDLQYNKIEFGMEIRRRGH